MFSIIKFVSTKLQQTKKRIQKRFLVNYDEFNIVTFFLHKYSVRKELVNCKELLERQIINLIGHLPTRQIER